jgi:hypothetical protein
MDHEPKPFDDMLRQIFGPSQEQETEEVFSADLSEEGFGLASEEDVAILMHRDIHFGGSFDVMIAYYRGEGKGIQEDIDLDRVEELYRVEFATGQDLAPMLLGGAEAEKVGRIRDVYKSLREICEMDSSKNCIPKLLAELILSEDVEAENEVQAIVEQGSAAIPALSQLISSKDFYDPLYPGYGTAPSLAVKSLGKIKDPVSIPTLFEAIDAGNFDDEETVFHALVEIGPKAKQFLLRVLTLRPLTSDNERAARALTHFVPDEEVAKTALEQLQDPELCKHENLAAYLVLCCEGLRNSEDQQHFLQLDQRADLHALHQDIQAIAKSWK